MSDDRFLKLLTRVAIVAGALLGFLFFGSFVLGVASEMLRWAVENFRSIGWL